MATREPKIYTLKLNEGGGTTFTRIPVASDEVCFDMPSGGHISVRLIRSGQLEVMHHEGGRLARMVILPRTSNVFMIEEEQTKL